MPGKRNYTFVLKNITTDLSASEISAIAPPDEAGRDDVRDVITYESSDVEYENEKRSTAVSDLPKSVQERRRTIVTMYDVQRNVVMPLATEIPCWWDRCEFSTPPLGAPIVYHPHIHDDEYTSESGRTSGSKAASAIVNYFQTNNIQSDTNDYFETEGVFCSVPCIKAYVLNESPFDGRLRNSLTLLTLMHSRLGGTRTCSNIPRAPDWKLIDKHGGPLSIEQFRNAYPRFSYRASVNTKRPFMFPSGSLYEQVERVVV